MNEPERKRRRTNSPTDEASSRQSSPLRKQTRRPSFASPTKASLARNYPNLLLEKSLASPARRSPSRGIAARGQQARASGLGQGDVRPDGFGMKGRPYDNSNDKYAEENGYEHQNGTLFSSPSKRPPRMKTAEKQIPKEPETRSTLELDHAAAIDQGSTMADPETNAQKQGPPDPEIERKKRERVQLQRELAALDAQVSRCVEEISREKKRPSDEILKGSQRKDLMEFINKINDTAPGEQRTVPISSLLCSFLPFSAISLPRQPSKQPEKPVASHKPVELDDPLPYLEMFTSLSFSSNLSLPRGNVSTSSNRVQQQHIIEVTGPQRLLNAQMSINIDILKHEIAALEMLNLSSWAERELGTFMRSKASDNDLANMSWAMDSYWNVATKRAQHWHRCEQAFAHLVVGHANEDMENAQRQAPKSQAMSRKQLHRHLGRDVLVLQDKHVLLKLVWRIGFDWTGEAESQIGVETALPSVWTEADTAASFKKIPATFSSLLHAKGAFEATRIMTSLLFAK